MHVLEHICMYHTDECSTHVIMKHSHLWIQSQLEKFLCIFCIRLTRDDVIIWKHFPRYWPFVRGIHRGPVNSPHKGQWRGALTFSLISARINGWVNNGEAGDLIRHRAHYDVTVMKDWYCIQYYLSHMLYRTKQNSMYIISKTRLGNCDIHHLNTRFMQTSDNLTLRWVLYDEGTSQMDNGRAYKMSFKYLSNWINLLATPRVRPEESCDDILVSDEFKLFITRPRSFKTQYFFDDCLTWSHIKLLWCIVSVIDFAHLSRSWYRIVPKSRYTFIFSVYCSPELAVWDLFSQLKFW